MSAPPAPPRRRVACPGCGATAEYSPANPYRPFCSARCRQTDLGAWASEAYRIPLREDGPEASPEEGHEDEDSRG
ncbi:MAG: DNA gyrase inhibitor YacG [Burkholderiales bacterium]